MSDWVSYKLGELSKEITVGHVGPMASQYVKSGVTFLRSQNVAAGHLRLDDVKFISHEFHARLKKSQITSGDIVIVRTGEPGNAALITKDLGEANCSDLVIVRLGPEIDAKFVCYAINATARDFIRSHTVGAVQQHFNVGAARELPLRIPELAEQYRVSEVLGALDDKIAVNERIAATYDDLLQLRFALLGMDSESGDLPVRELIEFNPRCARVSGESAVYVDMASLPTAGPRIEGWIRRVPKSGARFMNGDTLLARITPCLENGKTGFVDFLQPEEVATGSTEFIVLRAKPGVPEHLPYFLARSPRFRGNAIRQMVGSSGRQRVAAADLQEIQVSRPGPQKLREFGEQARTAFTYLKSLANESRVLAELRDTLLPKLMSGEIRVKDAERWVGEVV
jgi:type I restriction enzyme S subunit